MLEKQTFFVEFFFIIFFYSPVYLFLLIGWLTKHSRALHINIFFNTGLPSAQLRKAMGLQEDQLPSYIYRMRELGHPPGWLKAAEINYSGLGM